MRARWQAGWALGAMLLAVGVARLGAAGVETESGDLRGRVQDRTMDLVLELRPMAEGPQIQVRVDAHVRRGIIAWTLTDPAGEIVFRAQGTDGHVAANSGMFVCEPTCSATVSSQPGTWRLAMKLEGFTGSYRVHYEGLEPVPAEGDDAGR